VVNIRLRDMSMIHNIIDKKDKEDLIDYISEWSKFSDIDTEKAFNLAIDTIKFYNGKNYKNKPFQYIEDRWYNSLSSGNPDYGIYDEKYLLSDIWACWILFSRQYILRLLSNKSLYTKSIISDMLDVNSIVDLGCGFGYTTATFKEIFPDADVYGTNFEGGIQWKLASHFGSKYNFSLYPDVQTLNKNIDFVFASEYFEHIENPIDHLNQIIEICKPKYLVLANAFGTVSIGHFNEYYINGVLTDGKKVSRLFNAALKAHGYENVKTKCWNNRPTYWKKK